MEQLSESANIALFKLAKRIDSNNNIDWIYYNSLTKRAICFICNKEFLYYGSDNISITDITFKRSKIAIHGIYHLKEYNLLAFI